MSTYSSIAASVDFEIIGFDNERYKKIDSSVRDISRILKSKHSETDKKIAIIFRSEKKIEKDLSEFDIVIYFYINHFKFKKIKSENTTAIFSGQPIDRQISLALAINKESKRLSIPWLIPDQINDIDRSIKRYPDIKWNTPKLEGDSKDQTKISKSLHDADALIAIDDTDIYNAKSLRSILLSAYRLRKPMIGPGPAFVKAGSMASVYSDLDAYLIELESLIESYLKSADIPEPRWPKNFRLMINDNVARSLGYLEIDRDAILEKIKNDEITGNIPKP